MEDIENYDIPVYNFPYDVEEDDEETIQDNSELRVSFILLQCYPYIMYSSRLFFPLPLLVPRKKLKLMGSPSELVSTLGALRKSTTPSILTSADSEVLSSSSPATHYY